MSRRIRGLDKLLKQLNDIGGNTTKVLKESIEECTSDVRDDARLRCPSDIGELRRSIDYDVEVKNGQITGTVYTNMEYAPYVEFGTGKVGERTNENSELNLSYRQDGWTFYSDKLERFVYTEGQAAQPFMYPALHDNRQKIRNKIVKDVRKEIKRLGS